MSSESSSTTALGIAVAALAAIILFWAVVLVVILAGAGASLPRIAESSGSSPWNALEVAKLFVAATTPLMIAVLGIYLHRLAKRFEHAQWRNQKIIEKRLAIYDDLAPQLNDLLCYFTYLGGWKESSPPEIVKLKRVVDRKIYLAQPIFSKDFFDAGMQFTELAFASYQGWGKDAKLRTPFERRKEAHPNWNPAWEDCFSAEISDPEEIRLAYVRIMTQFSHEIGLRDSVPHISSGEVPEDPK